MIVSCSWCHEPNDLAQFRYCATCGHRADLPRAECDCEQCQAQPFRTHIWICLNDNSTKITRSHTKQAPICGYCGKDMHYNGTTTCNRPASREEQHGRYIDCGPAAWDDR